MSSSPSVLGPARAEDETGAVPAATPADARRQRIDIQALRAVAVGLVVVYHFFPDRLTGGFVGVDVFFVLSGFLITTHLLERPPVGGRDLAEFWGRRIRRLLPAALLVLLATLLAVWLLAPVTSFGDTARQAAASALYVQNWALAHQSVDYLAADATPTAVQHYWSLAVEEQFYLVWPILLLGCGLVARRRRWPLRRVAGVAVAAVVTVSLGWSIATSADDPASYFVSWTRFWELGIGALAAVLAPALGSALRDRVALRNGAAWVGVLAIVVAAVTYDGATVFPGAAALLPVLGTAVVVLADASPGPGSPLPVAGLRPVQVLGDLSYSVYLWHWPVVVLLPEAVDGVRWWHRVAAIVAVLAVSAASQRWVEEPLRGRTPLGRPLRRSYVFALAGMALVVVASLGLDRAAGAGELSKPTDTRCFGAAAAVTEGCDLRGGELYTDPVFAADDLPAVYRDSCMSSGTFELHPSCTYGSTDPDSRRVALVGNSHAGQYLPILQRIARRENWQITTYLAYECHTVDRVIVFPEPERTAGCAAWNEWAIVEVADGDFDLVVTSNRTQRPLEGFEDPAQADANAAATEEAYERVLRRWSAGGAEVLVARDNPRRDAEQTTAPDCVAEHPDDLAACDRPLAEAEVPDPQYDAARRLAAAGEPWIRTFDPTRFVCPDATCRSVVGGVVVWWDTNHLTKTFAATLTPFVRAALDGAGRER